VGGVGEGQLLGEAAAVASRQLARVEGDGDELALADAKLDPAAGEAGVDRVVVGVPAQVGLLGDAGDEAVVGTGHALGQRRHQRQLLGEALGDDGPGAAMASLVDAPP
jgi:hypothetical protein